MPHTQQADSETASALEQLRSQLTQWRQTHRPPTPIPSEIWARAVEIAQKLGVSPTARALRVGHVQLKQRMESQSEPFQPGPAFLEWFAPMSASVAECSIVVESERGTKVQVELKNVSPQWVASMLRDLVA